MIKRSLVFKKKRTLALLATVALLIGLHTADLTSPLTPAEWAGEPPYLTQLRSTGIKVTPVSSSELSDSGLRGWEIQRQGDRLFAYSPLGSKSVIVGGTLYNAEGEALGTEVEVAHQRQQLVFKDFVGEATWLSLAPDGSKTTPAAYLLIDPATDAAREGYSDLLSVGVDLTRLWVAPYPESDNPESMPVSTAIYESDYRTPVGASPIVTERRGGDLGFTHHSHEALIDALSGKSLQPLAPYDHPAEVQAIQSIASAIYLKDRLDIPANSVLIEKKDHGKGLSWEIYPLLPVNGWIDQLNGAAGSPR